MKEITDQLKQDIGNLYREYYLPVLLTMIDEQSSFAEEVNSKLSGFKEDIASDNNSISILIKYRDFHSEIFKIINSRHNERIQNSFSKDFKLFSDNFNKYLSSIDETISCVQLPERFSILSEDKFRIKLFKTCKRILRSFSRGPRFTGNLFRRLFRRPLKEYKVWMHSFPARRMVSHYFGHNQLNLLLPGISGLNSVLSNGNASIWKSIYSINEIFLNNWKQLDYEFVLKEIGKHDFDNIIKNHIQDLENYKTKLESDFLKFSNQSLSEFTLSTEKTGTIERSAYHYSKRELNSGYEEYEKKYATISTGWKNNLFVLFDDWRLSEDIIPICITLQLDYLKFSNLLRNNFINDVNSKLDKISNRINKAKEKISSSDNDPEELKKTIVFEKEYLFDELSNTKIPELIDYILDANIPLQVDDIENSFKEKIEKLTHQRAIVKYDKYDSMIKSSDIDYIQSQEIISFDIYPGFLKSSSNTKNELIEMISNLQGKINIIEQVTDFNLESALALIIKDEEMARESIDLAIEGLDRSANRVSDIREEIVKLSDITLEGLFNSINTTINGMMELTYTEKLFQKKLLITKTKALEKTKAARQRVLLFIKDMIPLLTLLTKRGLEYLKTKYSELNKRFGLSQKPISISSEISDFLSETYKAIDKLPFIYQRLYRTEALFDERFFVSREEEFGKIKEAYTNWNDGKFAPLAVVGEKGSGVSSLINIYMKRYNTDYRVLRTELKRPIDKSGFLEIMKDIFNHAEAEDFNSLVEFINNSDRKYIVIIEGIQSLMIRSVGGFEKLRSLFRLISATNEKVMWICTCGLYAWQYLNKTINISDYFAYRIELGHLNNAQIIDIILKRHSVSGYKLEFLPSEADESNKKYRNLPDPDKQDFLEKEYFNDLNKLSKSNISIALYFWIRSTADIDSNSITIKSLKEFDFSFMSTMEMKKIFTLQALLIHDGITPAELSEVSKQKIDACEEILMVMLDDGIIVRNADIYKINPLLYRQTVNMLNSKNLLN